MKVYYNNTDSSMKLDFTLDDNNYLSITAYSPSESADSSDDYEEIGSTGIQLEQHGSYSLLLSRSDSFLVRNADNTISKSMIKFVATNRVTFGSRVKYEEVDNRYNAVGILQVDTNTISNGVVEIQVILFRVQPANINFDLPSTMEYELENYTASEIFSNGSKRHSFWDTYSLEIDGTEYKFSEKGVNQTDASASISMAGREYVDVTIRKYSNGFKEALTRLADNETVVVEATAGIANTQRVKLTEGVGSFRWYNLGYTGDFKIKLGWRWYSGIAEINLTAEE